MSPSKRAAGDGAAPPPGRRLRVTVAAPPGSSNPKPLSSPRRFLSIVLVVLFFKRPKGGTDSVRASLSWIRRLEMEVGRLRHSLDQVCDTLAGVLRKQEQDRNLIHVLTSRLDNIIGPSPNHHNHEQQGTNHEGTSAEAEGLAETESEGKDASIRLRFLSKMKPPLYHDEDIKSIRIGIFNGATMIKAGPFSKVKVEVLALEGSFPYDDKGSWTPKEFHEHIAYGRDGKGNVLTGKGTNAQLINGECHLGSIRFREGSCRARNGMFVVGARVCDGQAICGPVQEAVMNPVVVQDRRNKYNEKNHPPNLDDEVYRLEKIAINGKYRERLNKEKIHTVEHFLKELYKDEDNLVRILHIKNKRKDWDKMVKHAQECSLEGKPELKSYRCEERNMLLFFNCVHRLVGAKFGSRYIASDRFEPAQQNLVDKWKKTAYDQWDDLTEDHVMKDNVPVPLDSDGDADAAPSCMPSAIQQKNSGHHLVHQVRGTPATEALSPHAPTELVVANVNNAPGPGSSIPDPHSTHNCQACNTTILQNILSVGGISAAEGLGPGLNESPYAIANNGPSPSFSVPDHLRTQNYQGAGLAGQEQHFSGVLDGLCLDPLVAQALSFGVTDAFDTRQFVHDENVESTFLQPQADTNNWVAPGCHQGDIQSLVGWPGPDNGTLEASSASAHIYMVSAPHRLTNTGAPGSGQGSMQSQRQAYLPNDGTTGSSESAQQAIPPHQWSQYQGNMPGNRSY